MKTEGEFGFEPSLLVEMEREQEPDGKGGFRIARRATVLKDRFGVIDGASTLFYGEAVGADGAKSPESLARELDAVFAFFAAHVTRLKPGAHAPINTAVKTNTGADEDGDSEWARERKTRVILCEEIQGELVAHGLAGQSAQDKERRLGLLHDLFGTRSWTAVESMDSGRLRGGLAALRERLAPPVVEGAVAPEEAERRLLASACEGHETRLGLDLEAQAMKRAEYGITALAAASLDQLVAYKEALAATTPEKPVNGKRNGKAREKAPAETAS
jgi:hypothetical protein